MLFSLVVPIYNDGYLARRFAEEFEQVFKGFVPGPSISSEIELIFVNDGSKNNSFEQVKEVAAAFDFVKAVSLSRNFGQHVAISCGYQHAKGEYVGMMNVDMQEHPTEIIKLLSVLQEDKADITISLRNPEDDNQKQKFSSNLFHHAMNFLTGQYAPVNAGTLRIMNRKFLNVYNQLSERSRYLPALELWIGFRHAYVPIKYGAPTGQKKSSYTFRRRLEMGIEAVLGFSDHPLRLSAMAGMGISLMGGVIGVLLIIQKLFMFSSIPPGYASIVALMLFLAGAQIFIISLCGLYIGRTLRESQRRPLYIVAERVKLEEYISGVDNDNFR